MNRVDLKKLAERIDEVTREKLSREQVVSLDQYRQLKTREEPHTVLVVDDDATVRKAIRRTLETEGFRVLTAADATQLGRVIDEGPIELFVLDVGLPWINGFELAGLIREQEALKEVPFIFVSGFKNERDIKQGFAVGASDYLTKPFDPDELKRSVRTLLKLTSE